MFASAVLNLYLIKCLWMYIDEIRPNFVFSMLLWHHVFYYCRHVMFHLSLLKWPLDDSYLHWCNTIKITNASNKNKEYMLHSRVKLDFCFFYKREFQKSVENYIGTTKYLTTLRGEHFIYFTCYVSFIIFTLLFLEYSIWHSIALMRTSLLKEKYLPMFILFCRRKDEQKES